MSPHWPDRMSFITVVAAVLVAGAGNACSVFDRGDEEQAPAVATLPPGVPPPTTRPTEVSVAPVTGTTSDALSPLVVPDDQPPASPSPPPARSPTVDESGIEALRRGFIARPGRTYSIFGWLIDVPDGLAIEGGGAAINFRGGSTSTGFLDTLTGSWVTIDVDSGREVNRVITEAGQQSGVGERLDQLMASLRRADP